VKKAHKSIITLGALLVVSSLSSTSAYADNDNDKEKDGKRMVAPLSSFNNYCTKTLSKSEENQFNASGMSKSRTQGLVPSEISSRNAREAQIAIRRLTAKNTPAATAAAAVLTTALGTYNTSRTTAITTYNNMATVLKSQCESALAPFKATLATAATTAKNALNAVTVNAASTTVQKQSARVAYNAAITLANTTFVNASKVAVTSFQNQMNLAQVSLFNATQQADQILKNAVQTAKLSL